MIPLNKMLLDTYYHLYKDYGTVIQYTKPGKGDINSETGVRDTSADKIISVPAVFTPIGITSEFILKLISKQYAQYEKREVVFLVKAENLKVKVEVNDFFTHANLKYQSVSAEDMGGVLFGLTGDTFS